MKIVCTTSTVPWFTPGEHYDAEPEPILGGIYVMQDDLVSQFLDDDAWEAKIKNDEIIISDIASFREVPDENQKKYN
ncbi:hypothetical protein NAK66_002456 [Klebsiella oxytoca]|nr:hypothetical protein [Klebsiella oxytoca]